MSGSVTARRREQITRALVATPALTMGMGGAVLLAALGLLLSRPDIVALGLPLAVWSVMAILGTPRWIDATVELTAQPGAESQERAQVDIASDADWTQLAVAQGGQRSALVDVPSGVGVVRTTTRLRHSGPAETLAVIPRFIYADGGFASEQGERVSIDWNAAPTVRALTMLPVSDHLIGIHGNHAGIRPGHGGDFRDIRPFVAGDELRRVDWKATARLARQPGEIFVRRTDSLSDASIVIAMDTAEELGESVATWGTGDTERSGVTSLDRAREGARSLAEAAISLGDRVSFHVLEPGGRTVRTGSGARHLARISAAIAASGESALRSRFRRTPSVPPRSTVFVLSTFFDGAAAVLAIRWRASGHRVVAIDTLPETDTQRLSPSQRVALRLLMTERADVFHDLRHAGIDIVQWGTTGADTRLREAVQAARRR